MGYAELAAHKLYDSMQLDTVSNEVKRQLMLLILSKTTIDATKDVQLPNPMSLDEAMNMGAVDIETARKRMHTHALFFTKTPL